MDKVTALVELKERINTVGYNQCEYIVANADGPCYCSIGHLMNICGVDLKPFVEDDSLNSTNIRAIGVDNLIKPLLELGFTLIELDNIQERNDDGDKGLLNTYIDVLIARNEEEDTNE
jgi:hypothetical protein